MLPDAAQPSADALWDQLTTNRQGHYGVDTPLTKGLKGLGRMIPRSMKEVKGVLKDTWKSGLGY